MNYLEESTLWYFIGHHIWQEATDEIDQYTNEMNLRAKALCLPIEWPNSQCIPWAVCCRFYILSKQLPSPPSKSLFKAFNRGMSASMGPQGFFDHAFRRILENVSQPAFPGRSLIDSVADTFALASMKYVIPDPQAELVHPRIIETVVTDEQIHNSAMRACIIKDDFLQQSLATYTERRPGWFKRYFTNADTWLFLDGK